MMRKLTRFLLAVVSLMVLTLPARAEGSTATLDLYGTFKAMGIIVTLDETDDPDGNAIVGMEYRISGTETYQPGYTLSRISNTCFVGSLFELEPGTSYDVRVYFYDLGGPLFGTVITATAATRAELLIPAPTATHIVSANGSGTACSFATPCALAEGLSRTQAGEAVYLRGGIYYQGEMDIPRSGTARAPIIIQSYPGENAILDGSDPNAAGLIWTPQGSGVYRATVSMQNTHYVAADSERLFPYTDLSSLQSLSRDNTPGFHTSGNDLYVHLAGGADPNAAAMVVSRYSNAFTVEQDFIIFQDLTFRYYGQGSYAKAIYLYNANDTLIRDCVFAQNDLGIGLKYDSHRNVIEGNEFYDTLFDWPWADIKDVGGLEDGGIRMYSPMTGRGTVIRNNTFHDDFDGFGVCPDETAGLTNETDVYDNLIYRMGDDGVETDGECSNVRLWGNTFHDVLVGISLAPAYTGPTYAIRNQVYRAGAGNNDYPGSPFKFNSGYDQSGPIFLFHNTADAVNPGNNGLDIKSPGSWQLITARNNIWAGTDYAISNANPAQPIDLDYDALYTSQAGELAWWSGLADRHLNTLIELQDATGQEKHGLNVEPGFSDPDSGDHGLSITSNLIDTGVRLYGINDNYEGWGPDIGAVEYPGGNFRLDISPATQAIDPGETATYTVAVQAVPDFTRTVTLTASEPASGFGLSLIPVTGIPPFTATLTLTDLHSGTLLPGVWYTATVIAVSSADVTTGTARLLVGGAQVYLPLVMKDAPAPYYAVTRVRKLTACENMGNHHIYVTVLDTNGVGKEGVPVRISWGSSADDSVIGKTRPDGHMEFAMFKGAYSVSLADGNSQTASGITPDYQVDEFCGDELGNSLYHASFEVIFQQQP